MRRRRISVVAALFLIICCFTVGGLVFNHIAAAQGLMAQMNLFSAVLRLVKTYYVDEVDTDKLVDNAIKGMLGTLDPHTHLIPPKQYEDMDERMIRGSYEGIGIAFDIVNGYLTVISPIEGSPSDMLGIRAGDKIVKIDDESALGITTDEVFEKLRGPKGTSVHVSIRREGERELLDFKIIRDEIKIKSIPSAFMIRPGVGYIRMSRFARTTGQDLETALDSLETQGMDRLILDLRGNAGGFLSQAVEIADKFVPKGNEIVYTKGRHEKAEEHYYSTEEATHAMYPLIVMIDRGSASASEIVSGAVQDLDRGLVVGQPSYGKGLVENQMKLKDGSVLMLTVGRWYTPSGRLIQKPYTESYHPDIDEESDTTTAADSSEVLPVFTTISGREVFGGGGIKPDIELDRDERYNSFVNSLERGNYFFDFAAVFVGEHDMTNDFDTFLGQFEVTDEIYLQFRDFLEEKDFHFENDTFLKGVTVDDFIIDDIKALLAEKKDKYLATHFENNKLYIQYAIKREIAKVLWGLEEWYVIFVNSDPQVMAALDLFPEAEDLMAESKMIR
ncbi:MAG: S41 family peptidase [Gemmatimonadota bacterium]|nr:MAG: S41 family peptidase [Gemmatimonadota bacterium]